jgi:hypothetical protein
VTIVFHLFQELLFLFSWCFAFDKKEI